MAEPEWTRDKFHEKLITVKPSLARQLLETKLEDLTGIGDSDALFWYMWRFALSKKLKLNDVYELIRRADIGIMAVGGTGGLTAAQVEAFLKLNRIPHTEAGLRYFLQSLGLIKAGPTFQSAAPRSIYFKELFDAFEQNRPPIIKSANPKGPPGGGLKRSNTQALGGGGAGPQRPGLKRSTTSGGW